MKTDIHFRLYLAKLFLEREMFQTKCCSEKSIHILCYEIRCKNVVEPDRPPITIWRKCIACWNLSLHTHTHTHTHTYRIFNAYRYSAATVVARTRLRITYTYSACLCLIVVLWGTWRRHLKSQQNTFTCTITSYLPYSHVIIMTAMMWEIEDKIFNRMWTEGRRLRHSAINHMIEYRKAKLCIYDTDFFSHL
jgi:hypothetical protein